MPVDFTDWTNCGAVVARGPLSVEQDKWLYDSIAINTGNTYRNFAFLHTVCVNSIIHPNDYDIYTACYNHATGTADLLGQACGHRLDQSKIFPGRHVSSVFNSGSGEADWSSVCTKSYDNTTHQRYLHLRLVCY